MSWGGHAPRVCYFYDSSLGSYYYGAGHPMKPHRLRMTHSLLLAYGMYKKMEVYRPHPASQQELERFHASDYVDFIRRVTPDNSRDFLHQLQKYNLGPFTESAPPQHSQQSPGPVHRTAQLLTGVELSPYPCSCPIFDGMYDYCSVYAGGSIDGAMKLNHGMVDIAINWSGGLHHAKKSEASGFCYINDIVLAILELLKYHPRVLYIDIDIHHGDGVEEAFYTTDRVMTVSFHKFGDFFPGTGDFKDEGAERGKHYSVNVPLNDGIDDRSYTALFKAVISKVMEVYRPTVVVLQCGADSLTGDRLGCFNLTVKGHGECVKYVKSFGLPLLVLGGGGYNIRNVSRCWTWETAVLLDLSISNNIPNNDFIQYYGPDYHLHLQPSDIQNLNGKEELERTRVKVLQMLSRLEHAPSVQMQAIPPDWYLVNSDVGVGEERDLDVRDGERERDRRVEADNEFFEDDQDQDRAVDNRTAAKADKG